GPRAPGCMDAGGAVRPRAAVRGILAGGREPLLAVLRISPDFRPAYDPLLRMGTALGRVDPPAARALLTELQRVQPARPEAAQALLELPPSVSGLPPGKSSRAGAASAATR